MSQRPNRIRAGRESATSSARREKEVQCFLRLLVDGEVGARGLVGWIIVKGGCVPNSGSDAVSAASAWAYQPQYEQPHQQEGEDHQQKGEAQEESRMEFEAGPQGFSEGPYELSLIPNFGKNTWHAGYGSIPR